MNNPEAATDLLTLHQRLLVGDRVAPIEVLAVAVEPVARRAAARCRRYGIVDDQVVHDGVIDALLEYCAHPARFDPLAGAPLEAFLAMAAARNILNGLQAEGRRKRREHIAGRHRAKRVDLDPGTQNQRVEELAKVRQRWEHLLSSLADPADRHVLELWLQGVRSTTAFAAVLGVASLTPEGQRRAVKRAKDRIRKALQRRGRPSGGDGQGEGKRKGE
jgi:hypothetical protein